MPKLNTPLLSLEAHGTVGNAVTFQGNSRLKVSRSKPKLPYSLTLAQQYQRWLYEDYSSLWHQQSQAVKSLFRSNGVRFHLTGYQYWMKYQLENLPDIAGWWKLDDSPAVVAPDSSRNANTGTIIGAKPAAGLIDGCLDFDGINDCVWVANSPSLNPTQYVYLEAFIKAPPPASWRAIIDKVAGGLGYTLFLTNTGKLYFWLALVSLGGAAQVTGTANLADDEWHHVAAWFDGTTLHCLTDGADHQTFALGADTITPSTGELCIGARTRTNSPFKELIDNPRVLNRAPALAEVQRWALRRYTL